MLQSQKQSCLLLEGIALKSGVSFSSEECEKAVVGLSQGRWSAVKRCMSSNVKDGRKLLACVGQRLCGYGYARGCIVESWVLLSGVPLKEESVRRLVLRCETPSAFALPTCTQMIRAAQAGKQPAVHSLLPRLLRRSCLYGDRASCRTLRKDRALELCAQEDLFACLKQVEGSRDPFAHALACSYGRGASCGVAKKLFVGSVGGGPSARACLFGDVGACARLARWIASPSLGRFSCMQGDSGACLWMGRFLGATTPLGRFYLHRSCSLGRREGCVFPTP